MEQYAQILMIASPLFLILVLAEKWYGWKVKGDDFKAMDMISSLSSGFTNTLKDVLGLGISLITYSWLVEKVALVSIPYTWINVLIAFVALDFSGYWGHRINHTYGFFWNQHLIHHSSEEFNLACALRQSISGFINFFTVFLLPAAVLGVDPKIIGIVAPLHLFAQFWYHTVYIGKLGFLEKIIVTPSHHRVHHAINPEYIDKNHGQIFIIWDKWFGTFQEELDHVPPVYGITVPVRTWNPIKINFVHWWQMLKDAWHARHWTDKFKIWIMPTGWRPADVEQRYPLVKINDPYHFEKYNPKTSPALQLWSWIQFSMAILFLMYFFSRFGKNEVNDLLYYGLWMFLYVYSYTELMDKNPAAFWWELLRNTTGILLFTKMGGWFGLEHLSGTINALVLAYFVISTVVVGYLVWSDLKPKESLANAV